jgi:hypothetical protein
VGTQPDDGVLQKWHAIGMHDRKTFHFDRYQGISEATSVFYDRQSKKMHENSELNRPAPVSWGEGREPAVMGSSILLKQLVVGARRAPL